MTLHIGVLGDSYRRALRRLEGAAAIDFLIERGTRVAEEEGVHPIGLDFSVAQLPTIDGSYLDELRQRLAEASIMPTVIVGTLNLHADQELWRPPLDRAIRNLEVAHRLGSPLGLYYLRYGGRVTREGRIRLLVEQLRMLADAAGALGLRVTTENYDYFTSEEFIRIFSAAGRDNIGLHNDTGNWLILGEDPLHATKRMAPYTHHAHVRDYVLEDGVFRSVPLGEGAVDFDAVLPELAKLGAGTERMVLSVEMDLDNGDEEAAVRKCVRYLAAWLGAECPR